MSKLIQYTWVIVNTRRSCGKVENRDVSIKNEKDNSIKASDRFATIGPWPNQDVSITKDTMIKKTPPKDVERVRVS